MLRTRVAARRVSPTPVLPEGSRTCEPLEHAACLEPELAESVFRRSIWPQNKTFTVDCKNLQGAEITFLVKDGVITINGARVIWSLESKGITLHAIDKVLGLAADDDQG